MDLPVQNIVVTPQEELKLPHTKPDNFMRVALFSALVACGMALYLFWQNQQLTYQLTVARQVASSPSPSPSPSADPTTDWQIYSNSKYGFQIAFPPSWTGYKATIHDLDNMNVKNKQYTADICFSFDQSNSIPACILQIAIYKKSEWDESKNLHILSKNENYFFTSNEYNPICAQLNEFQCDRSKEIDQILSTFKFTNSN